MMKNKRTGALGEKLAGEFLKTRGYSILTTNYRSPEGEIDLIASKDGVTVFVEVRAKTGPGFGTPEESVTERKKQKLIAVSQHYLQSLKNPSSNWRIDFIGIELSSTGVIRRIQHIENAITEE
jgi:putative endonuclease